MVELDIDQIQGSGGVVNAIFGGAGSSGQDDATSLRSRAIIKVLYLLSEGEISGFPGGFDIRKFIYVNDTPIVNPDNTENFRGVKVDWRSGTQLQPAIQAVTQGAGAPVNVGVKVINSGAPVIRTINNPLANQIKVTLTTPGLSKTEKDGQIKASSVSFEMAISTNGGAFVPRYNDSFAGRTQGGYTRDYTFDVSGAGPWQVRVKRTNPDVPVSDTKEQNDLYWQAYTPIINQQFRYPNSALLYMEFDSAYFKGQPTVVVRLGGVICRVPDNYNPITRVYTGVWGGTFTRGWTNNPAWCLLELLTNKRFGCGNYIPLTSVDKWSLYRISQYCDGVVSNGLGGTEPRFVYNCYLSSKTDAFAAVSSLLAQIRAVAYYANGQLMFSQDRPDTSPVDLFTNANTVCQYDEDGKLTQPNFTYDYVSLKEKHSRCHVYYYDENEFGKKKVAYVDLYDIGYGTDIDRYGDEVKEVDLPGCTSEAEARRHARWILLTERLEAKTVSFATGEQGMFRFPGDLIRVADQNETNTRIAGRIVSATTTTVTLDDPVTIITGYSLSCIVNGVEEVKVLSMPTGTYSTLTVPSPFSTTPTVGGIWMVSGNIAPETYRIVSIGNPELGKYSIVAVKHAGKYAQIDSLEQLQPDANSRPVPFTPFNLTVRSIPGGYFVGWQAAISPGITEYLLQYEKEVSGYWQPIPLNPGVTDMEVILATGAYRFRVASKNIYNKYSDWVYSELTYAGVGTILSHNEDGSVVLSSFVSLIPGTEYFLDTYCEEPAGASFPTLPNPYRDRRRIVNKSTVPITTNTITVEPSFLGDLRQLFTGSHPNIQMYNNIVRTKLTAGTATLYSGVNFTGTATVITAGTYINSIPQAPPRSAIVTGGILYLSQWKPGVNPVPSSDWQITSEPLEAIQDPTNPITIAPASLVAVTV